MKWPRGKYNGLRIVGVSVKVQVDITDWAWIPIVEWRHFGFVQVLCFRTWIEFTFAGS